MLEAAEKTVSRSFLCLWFVVSQSVMLVERLFFVEQNALSLERISGCVCVVFIIIIIMRKGSLARPDSNLRHQFA